MTYRQPIHAVYATGNVHLLKVQIFFAIRYHAHAHILSTASRHVLIRMRKLTIEALTETHTVRTSFSVFGGWDRR